MLGNVTLTRIPKKSILFLELDEAAIVTSGQLYLYSHYEDVACPCLQAIFNPGDIVGLKELAKGMTVNQHSWLVTNNDCDVFLSSKEYVRYLWHLMKKSKSGKGIVEEMLKKSSGMSGLSE